ncbi:hypothetical protein ED867_20840, partial [Acinetobacter baumannii]
KKIKVYNFLLQLYSQKPSYHYILKIFSFFISIIHHKLKKSKFIIFFYSYTVKSQVIITF